MKAPLSKLKLDIPFTFKLAEFKLFSILSQMFGNTLTELDISGIHFSGTNAQFPHLQTLKIYTRYAIPADVFANTFPNLKSLDIETSYPKTLSRIRQEATRLHALNKARLSDSQLPLPSLQYLKASPTDLFATAMAPQAKEFEVVEMTKEDTEWLSILLVSIRPSILRIHLDDRDGFLNLQALVTSLQTLLKENPFIESLDLFSSFDVMFNGDAVNFLDLFPEMIKGASLKSLYLLIREYGFELGRMTCLRSVNIDQFIAGISVKCPDTQSITVDLKPIDMEPGETGFTRCVDIDKEFQKTGKTFRELREDWPGLAR